MRVGWGEERRGSQSPPAHLDPAELLGIWGGLLRNFFLTKLKRILTSLKFTKVIVRSLEHTWRKTLTHVALYSTNPKQFRDMQTLTLIQGLLL